MARIELEHVTKRYPGGVPAVNDLTLESSDGDFMVLVGPSGSGKPAALSGGQRQRVAMGRAIVEDLTPPVEPDRDHWRGGKHAAVTLVEYGDYECPYSRMAFRTIQRLERQLGDQLRFVFRHLPLTRIHPHALAAAHMAEAAAVQGRFWPMHELLFGHQKALEDQDLLRYADQLGLDRGRLAVDLDSPTVRQRVRADAHSALESGARGTPTLFINGRLHHGGYDEATLRAALATAIEER